MGLEPLQADPVAKAILTGYNIEFDLAIHLWWNNLTVRQQREVNEVLRGGRLFDQAGILRENSAPYIAQAQRIRAGLEKMPAPRPPEPETTLTWENLLAATGKISNIVVNRVEKWPEDIAYAAQVFRKELANAPGVGRVAEIWWGQACEIWKDVKRPENLVAIKQLLWDTKQLVVAIGEEAVDFIRPHPELIWQGLKDIWEASQDLDLPFKERWQTYGIGGLLVLAGVVETVPAGKAAKPVIARLTKLRALIRLRRMRLAAKLKPADAARLAELEKLVRDLDLPKLIGSKPPNWMLNPHVHHILFKKGLGPKQQKLVLEGMEILSKKGINPITEKGALVWAPNVKGQHTREALEKVVGELRKLNEAGATKKQFLNELAKLGKQAARKK